MKIKITTEEEQPYLTIEYEGREKKELIEKGFSFQGECDSEVFLWAYIYKGIDYIDWLNEKGVNGSASVLIQDGDKIIAYTNNGTLQMFETPTGIMGFSNDVLGYHEKYKSFEIESNVIYEVTDNVYILKENTKLKERTYTKYYYDESYSSDFYKKYLEDRKKEFKQTKLVTEKKPVKESDFKFVTDDEKIQMKRYYRTNFRKNWKKKYFKELARYNKEIQDLEQAQELETEEYNKGFGAISEYGIYDY